MWMRHRVGRLTLALLAWCAMLGATAPALAFDIERTVTAQAIPSPRQGLSDAYIVSFGLFGPESVFESEARGAARVLQAWFGATVEPVVRFNSKRRAFATARTVAASLRAAGAAMDRDKEVLVVVLSSHGSPDGLAIVAGRREDTLTPAELRQMLDASGAKYRVVIISACYSGVFVPALADRRTLVITAAAANRPSFGCEDGATWTYFGDAFFNRALRTAPSLEAAFDQARRARDRARKAGRVRAVEPANCRWLRIARIARPAQGGKCGHRSRRVRVRAQALAGGTSRQSDQRTLGLNPRASSREGVDDKAAAFAPASRRIGAQISLLRRSSSGHALFRYQSRSVGWCGATSIATRTKPPSTATRRTSSLIRCAVCIRRSLDFCD